MHELSDIDDLIGGRAHVLAEALEALPPRFEIGDSDRVLVRHGEREISGHGRGERKTAIEAAGLGVASAAPRPAGRDRDGRSAASW